MVWGVFGKYRYKGLNIIKIFIYNSFTESYVNTYIYIFQHNHFHCTYLSGNQLLYSRAIEVYCQSFESFCDLIFHLIIVVDVGVSSGNETSKTHWGAVQTCHGWCKTSNSTCVLHGVWRGEFSRSSKVSHVSILFLLFLNRLQRCFNALQ